MRTYFLILLFILPCWAFSQSIYTGDKEALAPIALETTIADMQVVDKLGKTATLGNYLNLNKKHPDKPVLIALFGSGEKRGIESLKEMAENNLGKDYNIIALFISYEKEVTATKMTAYLAQNKIAASWDQFLVLSTNFKELAARTFLEVYPRQIFTTSNLDFVSSTDVNPPASVKIMLAAIAAGLTKQDKIWYNKEGHITTASSGDAFYYEQYQLKPGYISTTISTAKELLMNQTFHIVSDKFLQDGILVSKNLDANTMATGKFKDGVPIDTVTRFFPDGKIKSRTPVNGIFKSYDNDGVLVQEGPIVNGLGNGVFTSYSKGKKAAIYQYRMGEMQGIQQEISADGKLSEWFASPEFEVTSYLSEGLQAVKKNDLYGYIDRTGKTILPFIYQTAYSFEDGKAPVTLNGDYFDIDKKGTESAAQL